MPANSRWDLIRGLKGQILRRIAQRKANIKGKETYFCFGVKVGLSNIYPVLLIILTYRLFLKQEYRVTR